MSDNQASMFYNDIPHDQFNWSPATTADGILARGGHGLDILDGTGSADRMKGQGSDDILSAGAGDDRVLGGTGDDWIDGGEGADIVQGGNGDDVMSGGATAPSYDPYFGLDGSTGSGWYDAGGTSDGGDRMFGGNGNDTMSGDGGDDFLAGGNDDDLLCGGDGRDELRGGHGNDMAFGDAGDDILRGGRGDDILSGGAGCDSFAFGHESGRDLIVDWEAGDLLDFSDLGQFDLLAAASAVGDDLVIALGAHSSVTLAGILGGGLTVAEAVQDLDVLFG